MSWRLGRWSEHLLARLVRIVGGGPAFLEPGAVAADATTWGHQAATSSFNVGSTVTLPSPVVLSSSRLNIVQ
jgi:hypothetical protein